MYHLFVTLLKEANYKQFKDASKLEDWNQACKLSIPLLNYLLPLQEELHMYILCCYTIENNMKEFLMVKQYSLSYT